MAEARRLSDGPDYRVDFSRLWTTSTSQMTLLLRQDVVEVLPRRPRTHGGFSSSTCRAQKILFCRRGHLLDCLTPFESTARVRLLTERAPQSTTSDVAGKQDLWLRQ